MPLSDTRRLRSAAATASRRLPTRLMSFVSIRGIPVPLTLNQRVQGSNPCAPTNRINALETADLCLERGRVRTVSALTLPVAPASMRRPKLRIWGSAWPVQTVGGLPREKFVPQRLDDSVLHGRRRCPQLI